MHAYILACRYRSEGGGGGKRREVGQGSEERKFIPHGNFVDRRLPGTVQLQ